MAQIDKPNLHFNTVTYTGNGSARTITTGMQPDLNWIKRRNAVDNHWWTDSVRGATKYIGSNRTNSEATESTAVTGITSTGFTLGDDSNQGEVNANTYTYCSWNWKANGAGSSNTDGTITSTVSANTTAGFSISKYVGNDTPGATVGHGLGAVPKMIIVKRISGSAQDWIVYHGANTSAPETDYLQLNSTAATGDSSGVWNDTAPTSSVFSLGSASSVNGGGGSDSFIAYCFAEKKGYSKFGSYTGNGNADGTFVYLGFKPAFLITKRTDSADNWGLLDNKRDGYNLTNKALTPNSSGAEYTSNSPAVDFLANGFKIRESDGVINGSGGTYIYMAFAENPIVGSNNVVATAR